MKFKKTLIKPWRKFTGFIAVFIFIFFAWIINLSPKSVSDINVQLSLLAMEKGYQGVTRMNSGDRTYSPTDYIKKLILSPQNLSEATFEPLPKIYLELPFEEESILRNEINSSLSFKVSNERNKLNLEGQLRVNSEKAINVTVNLKGNGIDHLLYKDKESIRIEFEDQNYNDLSEFSLQHPLVRDFQLEPIYMAIANDYGIITTHLELVKLNLNGKNKGIFLLEEVGTKEHLERQGKLNSVVIRFSAPRNPELIGSTISASGRSETYRTARFDSLNTSKIRLNQELYEYEKKAKGMLRSYLNGSTQASEIFDTQLIGRYLGIAEVLGGLHPLIFQNFLFYYNPETQLLEPIAYDASLHQRYNHSNLITNLTEGFVEELLYDEDIFTSYSETVYDLSYKLLNDVNYIAKLKYIEDFWYQHLIKEFWLLEKINFKDIQKRSKSLQEKSLDSLKSRSSRKQLDKNLNSSSCNAATDIEESNSEGLKAGKNKFNLINSEFFYKDQCTIIRVWSTAFDFPKDDKFPESSFCYINKNLRQCQYKDIKIKGVEIVDMNKSTFFITSNSVDIEYSAMYNFGFPEIPNYLTLKTPIKNIKEIKIFYVDLLTDEIVFTHSEEINYFNN